MKTKFNLGPAWVIIGIASLGTRVVAGYNRLETDAAREEYLLRTLLIAGVVVGLLGLSLLVFSTIGKATLAAVRFDHPTAITFQSSPASVLKTAVRALQRVAGVDPARRLTVWSPSVVIDENRLVIWRGQGGPQVVLSIPRNRITAVGVALVRDGIYSYPSVQFTVTGGESEIILPVPVLREGSALRGVTPEDAASLADRIRDLLGISTADAPNPPLV